jgi:hypothetical protein
VQFILEFAIANGRNLPPGLDFKSRVNMGRIDSKIIMAYKSLWTAFYKTNSGVAIKLEPLDFQPKYAYNDREKTLRTERPALLKIKGWPYGESSNKRFDIFIEIMHTIKVKDGKNPCFTSSNITVTYLEHIKGLENLNNIQKCNVFGVIRYDFDENRDGHPVFHAHVGNKPIRGDIIHRTYRNKIKQIKNLRIPTPPIDLKAVLVGLVADHYLSKLKDLRNNNFWKKAEADLPIIPTDSLIDRIKESGKIESLHWYIRI